MPPLSDDGQVQKLLLPPSPALQLIFVNLASHSPVLETAVCCGVAHLGYMSLIPFISLTFLSSLLQEGIPALQGIQSFPAFYACSLCACYISGTVFKHYRLLEMLQLKECCVRAAIVLVRGTRRT